MSRSSSLWKVLVASCLLVPLTVQAAGPGPGADAESQTFDVTLISRQLDSYSGQFVFLADPEPVEHADTGELLISLSPDSEDGSDLSAQGSWWSFLCFWFAMAETETDGQLFAMGFAWQNYLFGKAGVFGDPGSEASRYRLFGQGVEGDAPVDDLPSDEQPSDEEPSADEPSDGDSSGDEVIEADRAL